MSSLEDIKLYYEDLDWQDHGEYWAMRWGGTDAQWHATILPRISTFLPAKNIVELGAGHGRLSSHLVKHCDNLALLDITTGCIEHCKKRFADQKKISCKQNSGKSLDGIEPDSIDFIFSLFSLVHCDADTLASYLEDIAKKLNRNGVAFLHHSNAKTYAGQDEDLNEYRNTSVCAKVFENLAEQAGLACRSQEMFGWDQDGLLVDCISVVTSPYSKWYMPNKKFTNNEFSQEYRSASQTSKLYGKWAHFL